jgi:glycyl-tRNA synthetase beta chain
MVGEFPELEGRMGYYYALKDGESEDVATAIREQYRPAHAGGALPVTPTGRLLAVADRLDTLAGIFAIGKRPSGNKDPFGLRRAALGIARILIESGTELDLVHHLERAFELQPVELKNRDQLIEDAYEFTVERMRAWYLDGMAPGLEKGSITPEIFESVRVRKPASPLDFHQRLVAVHRFMQLDAAESLAIANKRIANILRSADEKSDAEIDPSLFEADEEQALHEAVAGIVKSHRNQLDGRDYGAVLEGLAALKEPVDAYFDGVMVMDEDAGKRRNRLGTLNRLHQLFLDVADIGRIPRS